MIQLVTCVGIDTSYLALLHCCTKKCTFLFLATFRMIKSLSFDPGIFSFGLSWQKPEFVPDHYQFIVHCQLFCAQTGYYHNDVPLPQIETSLRLCYLRPGSVCQVTVKAVYNPASIDPGLTETVRTAFLSKYQLKEAIRNTACISLKNTLLTECTAYRIQTDDLNVVNFRKFE